jgi:hypothetical protein
MFDVSGVGSPPRQRGRRWCDQPKDPAEDPGLQHRETPPPEADEVLWDPVSLF